jgi:hypothetical protein
MSRPNLNWNDFMGVFRSVLLACSVVGLTAVAQQPSTNAPVVPAPAPGPGVVDPNAPVPIPQPGVTPEVDPNSLQPAPINDTNVAAPIATPTAKPKPKKSVAPALPTLRGTLASIDKTNMTIVVHGKSKDETLSITSKTRIFADNKPAILSDAKEGENIVAEYRNTKEKTKEALTLRLGGPAAVEKAAVKKATKPVAKKKPAAKPATPVDNGAATPAPGPDTAVTPLPDTNTPPAIVPNPNVPAPAPNPGTP